MSTHGHGISVLGSQARCPGPLGTVKAAPGNAALGSPFLGGWAKLWAPGGSGWAADSEFSGSVVLPTVQLSPGIALPQDMSPGSQHTLNTAWLLPLPWEFLSQQRTHAHTLDCTHTCLSHTFI